MASIIKVDTIQDQDGNNIINEAANTITIGASGDAITIPSGATFASVGIDDNATSTAMTIDSSGRVIIGGTTPDTSAKLTLEGGDLRFNTDDKGILWGNNEINGNNASDFINIVTAGSERMRIDSSGNVGIGTSSPSQLLHIENGDVLIKETGTSDPLINFATTSQTWTLRVDNSDSDKFQMRDATGGNTIFTADTSGNVGIGTTSPTQKLDVVGTIVNSSSFLHNVNNSLKIISGGNATNAGANLTLYGGTEASSPGVFRFRDGTTERMRIDSSGNVGINTSSPTAKLNVNGAIVGAQKGDSTPNNTDVSGVNSLTVSTGAGSQTINGLVGGVAGQVLHIIKTNTAFTLTIANQNATSPGDDIYTADGSNISLTNLGGVTLLYYNGAWYEVGK
jgi:hypothetical protein